VTDPSGDEVQRRNQQFYHISPARMSAVVVSATPAFCALLILRTTPANVRPFPCRLMFLVFSDRDIVELDGGDDPVGHYMPYLPIFQEGFERQPHGGEA
jgi:hypothetical protein